MTVKRVRHAGGESAVHVRENVAGEWAIHIDPEGLTIDSFHGQGQPHIHDLAEYDRRIPIAGLASSIVLHRVILHLVHNGGVRFKDLVKELQSP